MRQLVNTAQSEAWNGEEGRYWSDHHDRWNAVNEGFNHPLLTAAAITPGDRVLDVGCGAGQTTRLAARAATRGSVLGLDLSGPMLARARALAADEGLHRIAFEQGDAQVHPLPAAGFDVAISRFGIMFFADPVAAFATIGRALRPGGRLAFVCVADPARCEWVRAYGAARAALPVPQEASDLSGPGMFSLADPAEIRRVLGAAGFADVRAEAVEAAGRFGRDVLARRPRRDPPGARRGRLRRRTRRSRRGRRPLRPGRRRRRRPPAGLRPRAAPGGPA
ncbi:class I SAM-dependent methyltransferase, partial [Streptomyces sp. CBMA156]|uniref:class I SAM-dependent methyltransferase n=1 Tax=Streptomyces sp. CBMA156 TaxID=1930280 RepID=UPI001661E5F0